MISFLKNTKRAMEMILRGRPAGKKKAPKVTGYRGRGTELAAFLTAEFGVERFFIAPKQGLEKLDIPGAAPFDAEKLAGVRGWILIYDGDISRDLQKTVYEQDGMCVALADLVTLFEMITPGKLPMVLNEIGNDYAGITVCGNGKKADQVYAYLKEKYNVEVNRVTPKELAKAIDPNADQLILIADLLPDLFKLLDLPESVYVSWQRIVGKVHMTNQVFDIRNRILPRLTRNGVNVVCISIPQPTKVKRRFRIVSTVTLWNLLKVLNFDRFIHETYKRFHTPELEQEHHDVKILKDKGYMEMFHNGEKVNYDNGHRRTIGCKANYKRRIFVFGPCIVLGTYVSDENTIPSLMQRSLGDDYLLLNRGQMNSMGLNLLMRHTEFHPGDTVIYFGDDVSTDGCINYDLLPLYNKIPHLEKHITNSLLHCDACVNKQIAEGLCNLYRKNIVGSPLPAKQDSFVFGAKVRTVPEMYMLKNPAFEKYIAFIGPYKKPGNNGAVVMNCNPFTNGHLYLVTEAARQVDTLYVFVVEEDKAFFSFEDRIELVRQGTAHLKNVRVLNSGYVFASAATIPGYFERKRPGDVYLDATHDMMFFLNVAKAMDIHVRFAGSEPIDQYTNQLNKNMRRDLERYGVRFVEIERKESDGEVISASRVRKYLEEKNFDAIKKIVPETTYRYLVEKFAGSPAS